MLPVIFLAFANEQEPGAPYLRQLPEEARRLRQILEKAHREKLCELVLRTNATAAEILDVFQHYRNQVAVFHYGGHANGYQLLLESAGRETAAANAGGLATFLGQQMGLQLVFLNGCSTQPQVQGLLEANVTAVIATSGAIVDEVAMGFAVRFYQGLASGATLQTAYNEAAAAMQMTHGNEMRGLYWDEAETLKPDRWPWELYLKEGAEVTARWNLPEAANNPLFGLPPLPPRDLPECPFRHLSWFDQDQAELFFGRGRQIRELYQQLVTPQTAPIILFYGQSGVGKSSLLAAGLLPRLQGQYEVRYVRRDRDRGLWGSLHVALSGSALTALEPPEQWSNLESDLAKPVIVILDQVEEVFTRPTASQNDEFEQFLTTLEVIFIRPGHRPQGKLILSFRKEWLAEIERQLSQRKLPRTRLFLERLDRSGIVEVVEGVTRSERLRLYYGLTLTPGLAEIIADDLLEDQGSAIAPTLQILLTRLWERALARTEGRPHFDLALYQTLKKVGILLKDFLEQQLAQLRQWQPEVIETGLALDVLAFHTTPLGTAEQRSETELRQAYSHQEELLWRLVQQCKDLYLLAEPAQGQPENRLVSRLAHDTLAPLIRLYFDESGRPGQLARRILENRVGAWPDGQMGTPLDEPDLRVVEQGQAGMRAWSEAERQLVAASQAARSRRERERKNRRRLEIAAVLLILVVAGLALWQWQVSEGQRRLAFSRQLAAQSVNTLAAGDHNLALLLALEAGQTGETAEAEQAMRQALSQRVQTWHILVGHSGEVLDVSWSHAGDQLASAGADGLVRLWQAASGVELRALTGHLGPVSQVAWSPDDRLLATADQVGAVRVWDVASGTEQVVLAGHSGRVRSIAWSPDGTRLASASDDHTARIWEVNSGHQLAELKHGDWVVKVAWNGDGSQLVTASYDGTARIWAGQDGSELAVLAEHAGPVLYAAWSPAQDQLVTTGFDGVARLWTADSFKLRFTLTGHQAEVVAAAWVEDEGNLRLVTASLDGTASLWNAATGERLAVLANRQIEVNQVAWDKNEGRIITTDKNGLVRLWDTSGEAVATLAGHTGAINQASLDPSGRLLATAGADGTVRVWTMARSSELRLLSGHTDWVRTAAWNKAGDRLATASFDGTARLWDVASGQPLQVLRGHTDTVRSITWSPDQSQLLTASFDGTARIWDAASGDSILTLSGHTGPVWSAEWSEDGQRVVTASFDGMARVWNAASGAEVVQLSGHRGPVVEAAWSPTGHTIATAGQDGLVYLWDGQGYRQKFRWPGHTGPVTKLAWSPNGDWLATAGSDGIARVWDTANGTEQVTFTAHQPSGLLYIAWDQTGTRLATADADGIVWIWAAGNGQEIARLAGHIGQVHSVTWNRAGSEVVTAGEDGTIRLWDAASGAELVVLDDHTAGVFFATWDASDRYLTTTGQDNITRIYALRLADMLPLACARAARGEMTREEWRRFMGEQPYQGTCSKGREN
jgi:WD40 repeat protein